MKNLIINFLTFLKSLTMNDIAFFASVISLLILIVIIIYLFKTREKEIKANEIEEPLLVELMQDEPLTDFLAKAEDEPEVLLDLNSLTKKLIEEQNNPNFNKYEDEQEELAIISYEELLSKSNRNQIRMQEEINDNGLTIKKVDVAPREEGTEGDVHHEVHSFTSYEKEEAFLLALKELKMLLIES